MEIASGASLRHDDFEVVWFEGSNPLRYAGYMLAVAVKQVKRMPGVHSIRTRTMELRTTTPVQIDGEFHGREMLRIDTEPGALRLLMPSGYR
jgi:diacylglycerol kinase family enzyme